MARIDRGRIGAALGIVYWLSVLIAAALLAGCGGSPTAYTGPHLEFSPTQSAERTAFGENEWEVQSRCVGYGRTERSPLKVTVKPGWFWCGNVAANGCQTSGELVVNEQHFEAALSHELIHWFEASLGHAPDPKHEGAVWAKCDRLNNGSAALEVEGE